jgi:hypothetical protein
MCWFAKEVDPLVTATFPDHQEKTPAPLSRFGGFFMEACGESDVINYLGYIDFQQPKGAQ